MASIFQNAVNFIGSTLKQAATVDNLKDYRHASRLFVGGGNYRLSPKHNFLFHVFIDVNESLASAYLTGRSSEIELGLMAKSADLPKFNFDIKAHNAYNRINLVQNKVRYEDINIVFHDDSANVVRNFYYDYFRYYYRDSDYGSSTNLTTYAIPNKYQPQTIGNFGYQRRKESTNQFINSIRIYSLHQKKFSEYILINPLIKSFRHSQHQNSGDSGTMDHNMVIAYENVLYQDGIISRTTPDGFAMLEYYDLTPSPLRMKGGVKSIFGAGGLLDTAGSVLSDFENGRVGLGTILNAARAINTARGMNLKKSLVSEITGITTSAATNAIIGALPTIDRAVRETINPNSPNGYQISTIPQANGALSNKYTGLQDLTSVAALAGAAVFLNSTPLTNRYKSNPVTQQSGAPISGYNPSFPTVPGATAPITGTNPSFNIANDSSNLRSAGSQGNINNAGRLIDLDRNISGLNTLISTLSTDAAEAQTQITNTQNSINDLTTRLSAAQALTPPMVPPPGFDLVNWTSDRNLLVASLQQELTTMRSLNQIATATYNTKVTEINQKRTLLNDYVQERTRLSR
jgi:uncharacterized coiled-coil protein SlyX